MKKLFSLILFLVLVVPLVAGQPTVTRTKEAGVGGNNYEVAKHAFTATTSLDSIIVLNKNGNAIDLDGLEANRTIFMIQFNTAETTNTDSDFDVLWQVSAVSNASSTVFPGEAAATPSDWATVETDENDDSLSWVATFDAASYKGMKLRAILGEASTSSDAAVAIEAYLIHPKK